ncbi:putative dipeptidyl peptidase IV [Fimbriimonas ginsengisoli Gsoil 348]|uniref:Putative dipeptidyl peptidase IV n=1 Tax=Fimbriimonas ginsengisoli Gsoil 348 TaxID=661478 RepID=A0A068NU54_FIMGI|nr:putative dipeptidyl peptidase IV [Fimbriimonas ginsengisoli Gsoil 348]
MTAYAQDTLQTMPRYDRYEKLRREIAGSVKRGNLVTDWSEDSKFITYSRDGKRYRFDVEKGVESEATEDGSGSGRQANRPRRNPERGRQFDTAFSADGKRKAVTRDRNVYVSDAAGRNEVAVTTDGSEKDRTKYGIASWVYGEELGVREAMWWSPDGSKLAFYKFDESKVKDYYLQYSQTKVQDTLDVEAYPKAGAPNPVVTLFVYDLASKKTTTIDTRFDAPTMGEYVFDVRWSPDGKALLFNRTNRKQNVLQLCAADPESGTPRVIVSESQTQSWAENHPAMQFLKDGHRFIWGSERNGFDNLYLYDIDGKLLNNITQHSFDVERVVRVSEDEKTVWYTARSGENPYLMQLHRVGIDGRGDKRLTDPKLSHSISLSPDTHRFVDVQQAVDVAPSTLLRDEDGKEIKTLATSDTSKFDELKLRKVERFTFPVADGKTQCYGTMSYPSDFDPAKKYPLIVSVYGGPESSGGAETFQTPNPITELGFLHVWLDGRGTNGRGKAFRDAVYGKLGVVEIDDQAAGVQELAKRPYVDGKRVGIYGTSYGGYASVMAILRHPETFQVACASSPVTDWLNYDSIYTERFMGLPWENENKAGYDAGSAMTYANKLAGKLMLYYGTADNNVHPANTIQLVQALETHGKRYDLQIGPDRGHTGMNSTRMWEYFVTHLILNEPKTDALAVVWKGRGARR